MSELPPFLVWDELRKGRLVSVLDDYPFPAVELNLLFPSHRHPSSVVRAYLDFCQAYWDTKLSDVVNGAGAPDSHA